MSANANRRRERTSAVDDGGVLSDRDDSPIPGPATTTLRPPAGPRPSTGGRVVRALSLIAGVAVVLAASCLVAWGARRYVMTSPRFAIRTILVDGQRRRSALQIAEVGGAVVGKNVFALDLGSAAALIQDDPWVEKAKVERRLPSTIVINVTEREASAIGSIGGELYLLTRDGEPFKKLAEGDPNDLAVVTGISAEQVAKDRPGVVLSYKRALDVVEDMEKTGLAKRWPIQELHLEKDGSLVATIGKEAIALSLGLPPYREKILEAATILNELVRRKASAAVIFLDNHAHPERVVVRMR